MFTPVGPVRAMAVGAVRVEVGPGPLSSDCTAASVGDRQQRLTRGLAMAGHSRPIALRVSSWLALRPVAGYNWLPFSWPVSRPRLKPAAVGVTLQALALAGVDPVLAG